MENRYPGILETILRFENAVLPPCPHCHSANTADVQVGVIGRTVCILSATTKFRLIPNGPKPGRYYCNECGTYFGEPDRQAGGFTGRPADRTFQAFKAFFTVVYDALVPEQSREEISEEKWLADWREFWDLPADTNPEDVKE